MKRITLIVILSLTLLSCGKNSSPDGRAQLRDQILSQRIDELEKKQMVILDSIRLLAKKLKAINAKEAK